jgi:hypothetical protein
MSVGGSLRYESKGSIGFYGLGYTPGMDLTLPQNKILQLDPNRPIYSPQQVYVDLFASYRIEALQRPDQGELPAQREERAGKRGRPPEDTSVLRWKSRHLSHRRPTTVYA